MHLEEWIDKLAPEVVSGLSKCRKCPAGSRTERGLNLMGQQAVCSVLQDFVSALFPGCHAAESVPAGRVADFVREKLSRAAATLKDQATRACEYQCTFDRGSDCRDCTDCPDKAEDAVTHLLRSLPSIQAVLQEDILAAYEGDPAAKSTMEVVISYPGVYAIIVHRIAHALYEKQVPLIPRIMSEHAHSRTGIDIHPGAMIGPGFFIDHGTGVVIGETCVIGARVKIYQGVTLGALSFEKDSKGNPVKGIKRHPEVGDNVVIYAGATILGGRTIIGPNSEIGGNVWLTHSVPAGSKVYNQQPKPLIKPAEEPAGNTLLKS